MCDQNVVPIHPADVATFYWRSKKSDLLAALHVDEKPDEKKVIRIRPPGHSGCLHQTSWLIHTIAVEAFH